MTRVNLPVETGQVDTSLAPRPQFSPPVKSSPDTIVLRSQARVWLHETIASRLRKTRGKHTFHVLMKLQKDITTNLLCETIFLCSFTLNSIT